MQLGATNNRVPYGCYVTAAHSDVSTGQLTIVKQNNPRGDTVGPHVSTDSGGSMNGVTMLSMMWCSGTPRSIAECDPPPH
jgi:hypothetical protein